MQCCKTKLSIILSLWFNYFSDFLSKHTKFYKNGFMGPSREPQQIALFFHIEKVGGKKTKSTIKAKEVFNTQGG